MKFVLKSAFTDLEWEHLSKLAQSKNMHITTYLRAELMREFNNHIECQPCDVRKTYTRKKIALDLPESTVKKIHCRSQALALPICSVISVIIRDKLFPSSTA